MDLHIRQLKTVHEILVRIKGRSRNRSIEEHPRSLRIGVGERGPAEIHRESEAQVRLHAGSFPGKVDRVEVAQLFQVDVLGEGRGRQGQGRKNQ